MHRHVSIHPSDTDSASAYAGKARGAAINPKTIPATYINCTTLLQRYALLIGPMRSSAVATVIGDRLGFDAGRRQSVL
jgi:hypothetical protein